MIEYKKLRAAYLNDDYTFWYFTFDKPYVVYADTKHKYLFPQAEGHGLTYSWKITSNPKGSLKLVHGYYGTYVYDSPNYNNCQAVLELTITDSAGTVYTKTFNVQ